MSVNGKSNVNGSLFWRVMVRDFSEGRYNWKICYQFWVIFYYHSLVELVMESFLFIYQFCWRVMIQLEFC